jgi:hypothetical protein
VLRVAQLPGFQLLPADVDLQLARLKPPGVSPHRATKPPDGRVFTLEFVRHKTPGRLSRQHQVLRWVPKYLGEHYPNHSFTGSLFVLSTGEAYSVVAYGRLPDDFVVASVAIRLMAGDFAAAPSPWECPKCRHFMHCPA